MDMPFDIELIAMGASAGGVEALGVVLAALPADFSPTVVVVLHIPPDRASMLAQLYQARCALPVKEAEDKEGLARGTVYFAPPDYHLLIEPDKSFALSSEPPVNYSRPAIDLTFESAAAAFGEKMLGIILTGASADGAEGLCAVRQAGGRAWVQDPASARSPTMPAAALDRCGADKVMDLGALAFSMAQIGPDKNKHSGSLSRV
jgi:two-component system chemotaxis response regulator CheB